MQPLQQQYAKISPDLLDLPGYACIKERTRRRVMLPICTLRQLMVPETVEKLLFLLSVERERDDQTTAYGSRARHEIVPVTHPPFLTMTDYSHKSLIRSGQIYAFFIR